MGDRVVREDSEGVATLTLNRPEKLNALNVDIFARLDQHLDMLSSATATVGCVVLRGAGKAFCAGADLGHAEGEPNADARWRSEIIRKLSDLPQPVIAAVHGHCITGGLELALGADLILAAASARFSDTHGKWGFVAAWGMTQRLPRAVGLPWAKAMTWTSRTYTGQDAMTMGLALHCYPDESFAADVAAFAAAIVRNSWHSNFGAKKLLNASRSMSLDEGLAFELSAHPGRSDDSEQRVERFLRK